MIISKKKEEVNEKVFMDLFQHTTWVTPLEAEFLIKMKNCVFIIEAWKHE